MINPNYSRVRIDDMERKEMLAMKIHFSEEILMEILSRLPVRSLLRFKCVSEFWKTLLSNPYFKMKHLNHAKNDLNSQKLLVYRRLFGTTPAELSFYSSSLSAVHFVENVQKPDCPLKYNESIDNCKVYCSRDGLVLLGVTSRSDKQLLLWNPSTRKSTLLPSIEFELNNDTFGLGYDATTDGYKILKLGMHLPSVEILSLKSGSWKFCEYPTTDNPTLTYSPIVDVNRNIALAFVHGAFHWMDDFIEHGEMISLAVHRLISFSTSNEVYGDISLLEPMTGKSHCGVSVFGGMLCFYYIEIRGEFKLWVMEDYGVKESWTLLFTIEDASLSSAEPKYRFADGEVLLCCRNFDSSDYIFRTSKETLGFWPERHTRQGGIVYTESLISPKSLVGRATVPNMVPLN